MTYNYIPKIRFFLIFLFFNSFVCVSQQRLFNYKEGVIYLDSIKIQEDYLETGDTILYYYYKFIDSVTVYSSTALNFYPRKEFINKNDLDYGYMGRYKIMKNNKIKIVTKTRVFVRFRQIASLSDDYLSFEKYVPEKAIWFLWLKLKPPKNYSKVIY